MPTLLTSNAITAIQLKAGSSPGTPASGYGRLYTLTGGDLHYVNDAATDIDLSTLAVGTISVASQATNDLIYASSATQLARIANAASSVLVTGAGNVPSLSQTLPSAVQANITGTGTVTSGIWNAGAVTSSGAFTSSTSCALTGSTNNVGTITTGVWNAGALTSSGAIVTAGNATFNHGASSGYIYNNSSSKLLAWSNATANIIYSGSSNLFVLNQADAVTLLTLDNTSGALRLNLYGAGTLQTDASGNVTASSDERLKDIQGPFKSGLDAVLGLKPISFRYNKASGMETDGLYSGFSAQNVQSVIPEAVGQNREGILSLNTTAILAAVVNAVQELASKIKA